MAKGYKAAGQDATFTIKVKKVKAGSNYKLEIMTGGGGKASAVKTLSGAWKDGKETKDGVPIEISGVTATVVWKAQGPAADGDQRSHRAFAQVTVTDDKGKERKEKSQELEVYNDWIELSAVAKEDGAAVKGASFKVLVNKRPVEDKKGKTGDDGKKKVEQLPPGKVSVQWEKPYKLDKVLEQKGTTLKAQLVPAKRVKLLSHKGTSAGKPHRQLVNLAEDAKAPVQGSKVKLKLKLEDGKAGEKIYVKQTLGAANSKRSDVKVGLVGAEVKPWADKGGKEVEVDAKGEATLEIELGKAGGDVVMIEAGGTDRCKDIPPVFLQAWRKFWFQLSHPEGYAVPPLADLAAAYQDVCTIYEEVTKDRTVIKETDPDMPAGTWFGSEHFGAPAGKRYLVVGKQNRDWFHTTYFKKAKAPQQLHVILCHSVMDHVGTEGPFEGSILPIMYVPGTGYVGFVQLENYTFRHSLKTGNDSLFQGSWWIDGVADARGTLTQDDIGLPNAPDTSAVIIRPPAAAVPYLKDGKTFKYKLKMVVTTGTYPGYSNGKDLQLIAVNESAPGVPPISGAVLNILLIHEAGHNLKQVVGDDPPGRIPPGMKESDHGFNYHNEGWHCAYGLSAAVFKQLKDSNADGSGLRNNTTPRCVMYGQILDFKTPNLDPKFCVKCLPFVKARAVESFA